MKEMKSITYSSIIERVIDFLKYFKYTEIGSLLAGFSYSRNSFLYGQMITNHLATFHFKNDNTGDIIKSDDSKKLKANSSALYNR